MAPGTIYNKLIRLWRMLHPEDKGLKADTQIKTLYYNDYKAGKLDINIVVADLESQVAAKKLKDDQRKLKFCGFFAEPASGTSTSSSSVAPHSPSTSTCSTSQVTSAQSHSDSIPVAPLVHPVLVNQMRPAAQWIAQFLKASMHP